ncbi:MAG: hypothetical protein LH485_00385 [Sphingomonas bacterium]|nr:hypothetical protein [Sphingomonas bacterium]
MIALALLFAAEAMPIDEAVAESIDAIECKQRPTRAEIIVCGSRKRDERYRLPDRSALPFDPRADMKSVMNERVGWAAEGDTGTQSCSAVGPGGWTGCMVKGWKHKRDQTQWKKNIPTKRW